MCIMKKNVKYIAFKEVKIGTRFRFNFDAEHIVRMRIESRENRQEAPNYVNLNGPYQGVLSYSCDIAMVEVIEEKQS